MYFAVMAFLLLLNCNNAQKEPVKMTILSINHFESEVDREYQCYLSDDDSDRNGLTVESMRTGWTRDTAKENPEPPNPAWYNKKYKHYKVVMSNNGTNDAFGVFGLIATKLGKLETSVSTTRMRSDADIVPTNELFTQTVNIGDTDVTMSMKRLSSEDIYDFRWRHNNGDIMWEGSGTFLIDRPIQLNDSGIYECYVRGRRNTAKHGLNLLLVRACPATRWRPPDCLSVCDSCYNGGICDENNGKCVCPPGFKGQNCLEACGSNRFGFTCDNGCSRNAGDDKCKNYLFCLAHPFGCRCNTGFKGLKCDTACSLNTFGASCLQSCHCKSGQCDRFTGHCTGSGTCEDGWTGDSCQECDGNFFGPQCTKECHCMNGMCNWESGLCKAGGCFAQWVDKFPPYSCQTGLTNITYIRKNPGIEVPFTCTALQGPGGDLNEFGIYLSRHSENLENDKIVAKEGSDEEMTKKQTFIVKDVEDGDEFYCQLRQESKLQASLGPVVVDVYELPKLSLPPILESVNGTSITIIWSAWDQKNDVGDPPVVGYIPHYKKREEIEWIQSKMISPDTLMFTANGLDPGTYYCFSVSAVRDGEGGDGPMSEELNVSTVCDVPPGPRNVRTSILGERQELVVIFWELPSKGITCSSGITKFTLYYYLAELQLTPIDTDSTARSYILHDLTVGMPYTFFVTLSTSGGESEESNHAEHLVPVLPTFNQPPQLTHVTCNYVTMVWDKWTEEMDSGTPPLIYYIPYHRVNGSSDWTSHEKVPHRDVEEHYQFIFNDLTANSSFEFCVVAVREGCGGEGDKNNIIQGETDICKEGIKAYIVAVAVVTPVAMILIIVVVVFIFLWYRGKSSEQTPPSEQVKETYQNKAFGDTGDYSTISKDNFESQSTMYQGLKTKGSNEIMLGEKPENGNDAGYEVPEPSTSSGNIQLSNVTRGNVEYDKDIAQGDYEDPDISTANSNTYVNLKGKHKSH